MKPFDVRAARIIATALLIAAVLAFIYAARHTLLLFLFAIFFAYLIEPLLERAQTWARISRGKAIVVVYVVIFGGIGLFVVLVGPRLAREATKLAQSLPSLYERVSTGQIAYQIGSQRGWSQETKTKLQHILSSPEVKNAVLRWGETLARRVADLGRSAWWLALIPILAVFFLRDGRRFVEDMLQLLERRRQRQFLRGVLDDINLMLAHFLRAQMVLAALSLCAYTLVLLLLGLSFAVLLGVVGGVLEFIPIVGPLVAAALIVGMAVATGYHHLIFIVLFLGAWRVVQDYVNMPRIMGRHIELHPLATLFGVLVGAEIAGIIGVYLSVPIMATLGILWRRWRAYEASIPEHVVVPQGEQPPPAKTERAA